MWANGKEKIRIFNHPWHISHQYSLQQILNTEWDWLIQPRRQYGTQVRGDFFKGNWVSEYKKGKYDLAILHLDQQCVVPALWEKGKGSLFRELNEVIDDIPKIVIMHGTPYYPEYAPARDIIKQVKDVVGNIPMVVNSYEAKEQWAGRVSFERKDADGKNIVTIYDGIPDDQITVIWHGLDPNDWVDLPKEPRVITMLGPAGLDMYYDRQLLTGVKEALQDRDIVSCQITVDAKFNNFEDYREFMGRSLVYFHPCKEAPMSRSRTEAMLSGCCVITTNNQDADKFIVDGENGILVPRNPGYIADIIEALITADGGYSKAIEIGQKGKETAKKLFSKERYESQWVDLLNKTLKEWK